MRTTSTKAHVVALFTLLTGALALWFPEAAGLFGIEAPPLVDIKDAWLEVGAWLALTAVSWLAAWLPRNRALPALMVALLLPLMAACASPQAQIESAAAAAGEEKSAVQRLADRLLVAVDGPENRALRLCMVVAGASELIVIRAGYQPEIADAALGRVVQLQNVLAAFEAADSGQVFYETNLRYVTVALAGIVVDVAVERAAGLAGSFLGGLNLDGLRDRARVAAVQGVIGEALIRDIRRLFSRIEAGEITAAEGRQACGARIDVNQAKLQALLGQGV